MPDRTQGRANCPESSTLFHPRLPHVFCRSSDEIQLSWSLQQFAHSAHPHSDPSICVDSKTCTSVSKRCFILRHHHVQSRMKMKHHSNQTSSLLTHCSNQCCQEEQEGCPHLLTHCSGHVCAAATCFWIINRAQQRSNSSCCWGVMLLPPVPGMQGIIDAAADTTAPTGQKKDKEKQRANSSGKTKGGGKSTHCTKAEKLLF